MAVPTNSGFIVPTILAVVTRVRNDFNARIQGADAFLRKKTLRGIADSVGGQSFGLLLLAVRISNEIFPDLGSVVSIRRWMNMLGIVELVALAAEFDVDFTGTPTTPIPLGHTVVRSDGVIFETKSADVIGGGGTVTITVVAQVANAAGNTDAGTTLQLGTPIAGVDTACTVSSPLSNVVAGIDNEDINTSGRNRVLTKLGETPHGGNKSDYTVWVNEFIVANDVFVNAVPGNGTTDSALLGTVEVRFTVLDTSDPLNPVVRVPTSGEVASVLAGITDGDHAPITADVKVFELVDDLIDVTFTTLSPNTQAVQDAVTSSLRAMIEREGVPDGTIFLSQFIGAADAAVGENNHVMSVPAGDYVAGPNDFPKLGVVTFP